MGQPTTALEDILNARLATLLGQKGVSAQPEFIVPDTSGKRIDVVIDLPDNFTVALEAEKDQNTTKKNQARKEAESRLALPFVDAVVAVCYPAGLAQASSLDENTRLVVNPLTSDKSEWTGCDLAGLVSIIKKIPQELGDPDVAAKLLEKKIKSAVDALSSKQHKDIATALGLPPGKKGWERRAAERGLLVVAAASMFHARLDNENLAKPLTDARTGQQFAGAWPPGKLQTCTSSQSATQTIKEAWGAILAVDYRPVFETAIAVLDAPAYNSKWEDSVKLVASTALRISGNIGSLRHDLMGRLFHRLLPDAQHDGSYYTSTAAATLLAGLAIPPDITHDPEKFRVVDPACGTGTLLMATAERMQDINPGGHSTVLGKVLLEDILHGYDINLSATHMAATTLGLLSPSVQFSKMNVYETLFGVVNGIAYVGSLELYDGQTSLAPWPTARQADTGEDQGTQDLVQHDLVIMNPPYTRDSRRYGQFSDADKKLMKEKEEKIFGDEPVHRVSLGAMFMLLSDKLAATQTGCVATVLPLTAAGAPSAAVMWAHLLGKRNFYVETVIVSHDTERIFFSENTDISEMLVVMRRNQDDYGWKPPDTKILRLGRNPDRPTMTVPIYEAHHKNKLADLPDTTLWEWPQEKLRANDWTPVKFYSNFLVQTVLDWFEGGQIPTQPLGDIAEVGPAGQGVRDAFDEGAAPTDKLGAKALWGNDTQNTYTMIAKPIVNIKPKPRKNTQAANLWAKRGNLLIPAFIRWNTNKVFAVFSANAILGSMWVPVKPTNQHNGFESEKALCVWLNSTPGILAQMLRGTPKVISRYPMSINGQKRIPIPKFTPDQIRQLAGVFDKQKNTTHERLSNPSSTHRVAIDNAVAEVLGIDQTTLAQVRGELAQEPAIKISVTPET